MADGTTPGLWRVESQANTNDGGFAQRHGEVIGTSDGGYMVVWDDTSLGSSHNQSNVRAQKYDASGTPIGGERGLSFSDAVDTLPLGGGQAFADLHGGNYAVAFTDLRSGDNDIYVQIFTAEPNFAFIRRDSIDTGSSQTVDPSITSFANSGYVVSYTVQNSATDHDIMARVVTAFGTVNPAFAIFNDTDLSDASVLTTTTGGNIVAVWQSQVGGSTTNINAYYSVWSWDGTSASLTPVKSATVVAGAADLFKETDPDVAALAGGEFVVTWTDSASDGSGTGVRASIYSGSGNILVKGDFPVNSTTLGDQDNSSIVALNDGGFVVTWLDEGASVVRAQRFDSVGNLVGNEFVVHVGASSDSPDSAVLSNGRFAYALGSFQGDADVVTSIWDPIAPVIGSTQDFVTQQNGDTATYTVRENKDFVAVFTAGDQTPPLLGYQFFVVGGPDADKFAIDNGSGAGTLRFISAPDFEHPTDSDHNNSYVVVVSVFDGSMSDLQTIVVNVADVNEAPVIISNGGGNTAAVSIAENTTAVNTIAATDPDSGTTLAYSISGGTDAGKFQINASTGALSFITAPDFEHPTDADHNNSYIVQVRASDGSLSDDQLITVNVTNDPTDPPPGVQWAGSPDLGSFDPAYKVVGTGDFNHDGTSDILWRNPTTGQTDEWILANGQWSRSVSFGPYNSAWDTAGVGDFNHDGTSDVLWRNPATGQMDVWLLNNGQWAGSIPLGSFDPSFQVAGIGDFNGDGTSDILWRNPTTGATDEWILSNGQWSRSVSFGPYDSAWNVAGIGDFNHDGTSDVLWRNPATGQMDLWLLNDGQWKASVPLGSFNAAWQVAAVNDFNGDGTADVLWRNPATGQMDGWIMNNAQWAGSVSVGSFDANYIVAGTGDFDHSGTADILWRNPTTGAANEWLLTTV